MGYHYTFESSILNASRRAVRAEKQENASLRRLHPPQISMTKGCRITLSRHVASQIAKRCVSLAVTGARQITKAGSRDPFATLTKLHEETTAVIDALITSLQTELDAYVAAHDILSGVDKSQPADPHPIIDMALTLHQSRAELDEGYDDTPDVELLATLDEVISVLDAELESTRNRKGKVDGLMRKACGHALTCGVDGRKILDHFPAPEHWLLPDDGDVTAAAKRCVADDSAAERKRKSADAKVQRREVESAARSAWRGVLA